MAIIDTFKANTTSVDVTIFAITQRGSLLIFCFAVLLAR
jgi:hypothetical protein